MLVENQIRDGERLLERLAQSGVPIAAGGWLKTSDDEGQWYLYIASAIVDAEGPRQTYRRILGVLREMPAPFWVELFDVKAIGADDPLAKAIRSVQQRYPSKKPLHCPGDRLEGVSVEEAYIYPPVGGTVSATAS
jgi:hypothetical protein